MAINSIKPYNKQPRGQNLIRYLILPITACMTIILAIAFLFHLIGADNRFSSSEASPGTDSANFSNNAPLSSTANQTDNPGEILNEIQETQTLTSEHSQVSQYEYLPQNNLELFDGISDPRSVEPLAAIEPYSFHALVNKGFSLTADFKPAELVPATGFEWFMLHPVAEEAWAKLREACLQETGTVLYMTSAYRSFEVQSMLFQSALQRKGIVNSVGYNAYQGRSEHQLGLSIDIMDSNTMKNSLSFAQTETYSWLINNAAIFGFILRYPEHKVAITDYCFEPWHFRYVGIELANYLTENDLTLEEYYGLGPLSTDRSEAIN